MSEFTAVFGQTGPPHLDIMPELVGDGWVDISDVTAVTEHFGQPCIGNQSEFLGEGVESFAQAGQMAAMSEQTMGFSPPYVYGCRSVTWSNNSGAADYAAGRWWLPVGQWHGMSFCYTNGDYSYDFQCYHTWMALFPGALEPWQMVAATVPNVTYGPHIYDGQYCSTTGVVGVALECGRLHLGWASLYLISGSYMYNNYLPQDGWGFDPCG